MSLNKEETEVKNIEWLKNKLREIREKNDKGNNFEGAASMNLALRLVDQLDEPEVLSQEWVAEHEMPISWMAKEQKVVRVEDLQNLLVPKQELPEIPKFVAEWYENEGKCSSWWNWFYKWGRDESRTELEAKTIRWMQDYNEEAFVNMFLHGYEVAEEQKYYVMNNDNRMMLVRMMDGKTITEADPFKLEDMYEGEKKSHRLTEQEIKDYDPRYLAFKVPVEEMEE